MNEEKQKNKKLLNWIESRINEIQAYTAYWIMRETWLTMHRRKIRFPDIQAH